MERFRRVFTSYKSCFPYKYDCQFPIQVILVLWHFSCSWSRDPRKLSRSGNRDALGTRLEGDTSPFPSQ